MKPTCSSECYHCGKIAKYNCVREPFELCEACFHNLFPPGPQESDSSSDDGITRHLLSHSDSTGRYAGPLNESGFKALRNGLTLKQAIRVSR